MFGQRNSKLVATKGNLSKARRDMRITRIQAFMMAAFILIIIPFVFVKQTAPASFNKKTSAATIRGSSNKNDSKVAMAATTTTIPSFQPQECAVGIWNANTHTLDINPDCPASQKLLSMPLEPTGKKLTFMLIYFNDHHHLAHQLQSWINFGKEILDQVQFVIVDDGSAPGHTAAEFLQANADMITQQQQQNISLDILIYRIDQNLMWNIGGARNLGFFMSNTPWIFMSDGDTRVDPDTMNYILSLVQKGETLSSSSAAATAPPVYTFFQRLRDSGFKPHPAVMLIRKVDYWKVGGCDEDFVGSYGWTDPHFRYKVQEDPTLTAIKAHQEMDQLSIPPLREMNDDIACPENIVCLEKFHGEKAPKEPEKNEAKFKRKSKEGKWSNKVLRYTWQKVKWRRSWWDWLFFWSR